MAEDTEAQPGAPGAASAADSPVEAEVRDELPADLDVTGFVGPYKFPDNSRRRIPGIIYLVIAALCVVAWLLWHDSASGLVNGGFLLAAALLAAFGIYSITSGWRLGIDEKQALVAATREVGHGGDVTGSPGVGDDVVLVADAQVGTGQDATALLDGEVARADDRGVGHDTGGPAPRLGDIQDG